MEHRLDSLMDSGSQTSSDALSRARSSSSASDRSTTTAPQREGARLGKEVLRKDSTDGALFEELDAFSIDDDASHSLVGGKYVEPSDWHSAQGAVAGKSLATLMHQQQLKKGHSSHQANEEPLEGLGDLYAAAGFSDSGIGLSSGADGTGKGGREGAAKGFRGKGKMSALQTLLVRKGSEEDPNTQAGLNEGAGSIGFGAEDGTRTIVVRLCGAGVPNFDDNADVQPLVVTLKV